MIYNRELAFIDTTLIESLWLSHRHVVGSDVVGRCHLIFTFFFICGNILLSGSVPGFFVVESH